MASQTPTEPSSQVVNGDKQILTSQIASSDATPAATIQDKIGEAPEASSFVTAPINATSTFRALATVSYAERIRTSSPVIDNAIRKAVTPREEGSTNGKSAVASADGKPTNSKRTGKTKSGSSNQKRSTEVTSALSVSQGSGQSSGSTGIPQDDTEQGWQEVTAKSKVHQSSKGDKKDASNNSNGSARMRQHTKKVIINGTMTDENTNNDRPIKGKTAVNSRKELDKGDKESRHQQSSSEDGVVSEPTRRQQQQQKEKDGSSPKSLGMKSASWRSSPLGSQPVSASKEDFDPSISAERNEAVVYSEAPDTSPQGPAADPQAKIAAIIGTSPSVVPTAGEKEVERESTSATVEPEVEKPLVQPVPTATPVNIWQLRKEKMKSTSSKQVKSGAGNGKTVFNTLSETTPASQSTNDNGVKKNAGANRLEEVQSKKVPGPAHPVVQTLSSTGKPAANRQAAKIPATDIAAVSTVGRRDVGSTTNGNSKAIGGPPPRLGDDHLWPDIAASATKLPGSSSAEGKKKEKESEETIRPAATSNKKGKHSIAGTRRPV